MYYYLTKDEVRNIIKSNINNIEEKERKKYIKYFLNGEIFINETTYFYFRLFISEVKALTQVFNKSEEIKENTFCFTYDSNNKFVPVFFDYNTNSINRNDIEILLKQNLEGIEFYDFIKSKTNNIKEYINPEMYGKEKSHVREQYYRTELTFKTLKAFEALICNNEFIYNEFNNLVEIENKADVLNRNDIDIIITMNKISKESNDEELLLMAKFIFSIGYTFRSTLRKLFGYHKESKVDYMIKKLENNGYIETKLHDKDIVIIPSHRLENRFLDTKNNRKNTISTFEIVKQKSKNNYIENLIVSKPITNVSELYSFLNTLPITFYYKGTERMLKQCFNKYSRYKLEYYYLKLIEIQNKVKGYINKYKNTTDVSIMVNIEHNYKPLNDAISLVLNKCKYAIQIYGKNKEYQLITLKDLVNNGIHIYDISFDKNFTKQTFRNIILQTTMEYRTSYYVYKLRDIALYMSANFFEGFTLNLKNEMQFYDNATKNTFLNQIDSIKKRTKNNKLYFYFENRYNLAKNLSKNINIIE